MRELILTRESTGVVVERVSVALILEEHASVYSVYEVALVAGQRVAPRPVHGGARVPFDARLLARLHATCAVLLRRFSGSILFRSPALRL